MAWSCFGLAMPYCIVVNMENYGKKFERMFANSVPKHVLIERLKDNISSWNGGAKSTFSSQNKCDYILHDDVSGTFYGIELKTTNSSGITFWDERFEGNGKQFNVRKNQIFGLKKWKDTHDGVYGIIINFRKYDNKTVFIDVQDFIDYTKSRDKKSFGYSDLPNVNHVVIDNELVRTNYKYDIEKFINDTRLER